MADLIKKIKIKKQDGTFTDYIPIGAEAQNISTQDGDSVQLKLNKKPYYYNNVADMKADTKLKVGDMAITLGYYEANDGGGAKYNIKNSLTADNYSIHSLNNNLFAELIVDEGLYSRQVGVNEALNDNSGPLNHFLLRAASIGKSYLESGSYKITSPLTLYLSSSININGKVTILDYIPDNVVTINISKLNSESDSGGRPYGNTIIGADNGILQLSNQMSYDSYPNKIGMALGSSNYNTNGIIKNIRIGGRYAEGIKISPKNVWWLQLQDIGFSGQEIGLHIDNTGNSNAGEMITLDHCYWTRCDCSVRMDSYFNMLYTHCAWDFVSCAFYCTEIAEIVCDKCHFEGIGNRWNNDITTYNGFGGIFKARDTLLNYQQTRFTISNSHVLSPYMEDFTNKFFAGQSLYVNLVNNAFYTMSYYNQMCAKDDNFTYAWSSDDSVREVRVTNCHGEQNGYYQNFMLPKNNKIDGWLENEEETEEISLTSSTVAKNALILDMNNFELLGTGHAHAGTKVQIVPLTEAVGETKKMIRITPPYYGGQSTVVLRPKKKFALDTLPKIFTLGYTKGELNGRHVRVDISFFNENDEYISTRGNIYSNYGTMNDEHWFTQVSDQFTNVSNNYAYWDIPADASYYKIDFYMIGTNAAEAVKSAYFTNFYVNYQD